MVTWITRPALERLEAELTHLEDVEMEAAIGMIEEARWHGPTGENLEMDTALDTQTRILAQIEAIKEALATAVVADGSEAGVPDMVGDGKVVVSMSQMVGDGRRRAVGFRLSTGWAGADPRMVSGANTPCIACVAGAPCSTHREPPTAPGAWASRYETSAVTPGR